MATVAGNVQKYMHTLSACIRSTDSAMLCRLLTTDLGRHWGGRHFVQAFAGQQPAQYEQIVKSVVMSPRNWADVVLGHLACLAALASTDVDRSLACRHQCSLLENLVIVLSDSDTDWIAPAFRMVVVESRKLAVLSGQVGSSAQGSEESFLDQVASKVLMAFGPSLTHRVPFERSKKRLIVFIVNQMFKMYFKLNTLSGAKKLAERVASMAKRRTVPLERYPIGEQVTYHFYAGTLAMFDDRLRQADEHLSFALHHCVATQRHNKRLILQNLIPVRMLLGTLPAPALLRSYDLEEFTDLVLAVRTGDLKLFRDTVATNRAFYIRRGVYLLVEKLESLVFRTFVKRVLLITGTDKPHLNLLLAPLRTMGWEVDLDELECMLANLIHRGLIKGYMSHGRRTLVVSKKNPYPALKQVLAK